jgi:hypothetical protein
MVVMPTYEAYCEFQRQLRKAGDGSVDSLDERTGFEAVLKETETC